MPPLVRNRAAATAVAALFAAMPLLVTSAAQAAPAREPLPAESGEEVVFNGDRGLLGVSCTANPSTNSVTVPAETTLRVVNNTGYRAKLLLDGASQGEIADGGAAPVIFYRGPVQLGLKPSCMISDESAVRVEVVPAPDPTTPSAKPRTSSPRPSAGGSSREPRQEEPDAVPSTAPAPSLDETETPEPATAGEDGGNLGDALATVDETSGTADEGVAAEALSSVQPVRKSGPIGLLALIATVCVVGVTAGAIRAIIAQRATRTGVA
ncbi:hypothetical protein RB614_21325 [Phytohabitans sp. ZYX-F-186]|uniref:Uncharacterized protein n=1 Tax=Phytohabitans maris TaxID=3071409 RepID=A0ABU0ZM97_9ACTN|nr:hypothetical protein [Phytohabitans sp. ZYX-F-186]MDQ7907057.1 hypothetical protein [Phytohabitans sp. ZYX-F-186]